MIPPVGYVLDAEMIRDGGSLSLSFVGKNGSRYVLFLQVLMTREPAGWIRHGYAKPVFFERLQFRNPDGSFAWHGFDEVELSWQHALVLVRQMRHIGLVCDDSEKWLGVIEDAVRAEGSLPPTISAIVGPQRSAER